MNYRALFQYLKAWLATLIKFLKLRITSALAKDLEIIALRSELALFKHEVETGKRSKPRATPAFRQIMVLLSKYFANWKDCLVNFKPETVIKWHRTAFKFYWVFKSRKTGRPTIDQETIALIKQLHKENPLLSPEKIHEQIAIMGIINPPAPNTIAKYLPATRKPPLKKTESILDDLFKKS